MRAIFLPRDGVRRQRTHAGEQSGTQGKRERHTAPAFLAKIIERKAPRAVLCTLPTFPSLGDSCLRLQSARQPSRPQGRAALARAEINNTTCQAGTVPLLQSARRCYRTLASHTNADGSRRNSPRAETLTGCPTCLIFRAMTTALTTAQAAQLLGCSERTIRNMIIRGTLHASKIDPSAKSVYSISQDEVRRILNLRSRSKDRKARATA